MFFQHTRSTLENHVYRKARLDQIKVLNNVHHTELIKHHTQFSLVTEYISTYHAYPSF